MQESSIGPRHRNHNEPTHPMPRITRIAGSFVAVMAAYWAYALLAVPWIEPPADPRMQLAAAERDPDAGRDLIGHRMKRLAPLFPKDAWELQNPKILESEQVKLLMEDYHNIGDGRVEIRPCTLIFTPEKTDLSTSDRLRQAVIMEVPDGAMLEFDQPLDLRRMKVGKLVGGQLNGRITVRSDGERPGPEDDLMIVTRDVELTERHVWTPQAVDFRLGPNFGHGRQMHIKLLQGRTAESGQDGLRIGGVELFELRHLKRLHLELAASRAVFGKQTTQKSPSRASAAPSGDLPVEITCQGAFRYHVIDKVATFEDRVDVLQLHPEGASDRLSCELLSLFFTERPLPTADAASTDWNLRPERLEARGNPIVLSAPSRDLDARGERLDYDFASGRIALRAADQVMLAQAESEIHARTLQYQPSPTGGLGQIIAEGAGWLRGQTSERPNEQLRACWSRRLQVRPERRNQVISLLGNAGLQYAGVGRLDAEQIHFWLVEGDGKAHRRQPNLQPDRMLAQNGVRLDSPQLSGQVEELRIWFESIGGHNGIPSGVNAPDGRRMSHAVSRLPPTGPTPPSEPPRQHFEISGRLLLGKVLLSGTSQANLAELTIEDGVRFVETQTSQPGQRPLLITGDRLHVTDATEPHASVVVTGKPALLEARGLSLTGTNLNLNRGTNRMWIDGAGQLGLPLDRDLDGRQLPTPTKLNVDWQDRMVFDGRRLRFETSVVAATDNQRLQTETLDVHLKHPMRFAEAEFRREPQVESIVCQGGVVMENRTRDGSELLSHERMVVDDLSINLLSGALTAAGPGRLESIRRGSGNPLDLRAQSARRTAPTEPQPPSEAASSGLQALDVRFQGAISGNVHYRELTFHDQVRTAYAPAESWQTRLDPADPDALGPDGVVLHCDRLRVTQMTTPLEGRTSMELEAAGNTVVEGNTFTARASRISYAEAKDLLVLEGSGRTDAELFRQERVGGATSKAAARKILYWPKTNRLNVEGARSLELSSFSLGDGS